LNLNTFSFCLCAAVFNGIINCQVESDDISCFLVLACSLAVFLVTVELEYGMAWVAV